MNTRLAISFLVAASLLVPSLTAEAAPKRKKASKPSATQPLDPYADAPVADAPVDPYMSALAATPVSLTPVSLTIEASSVTPGGLDLAAAQGLLAVQNLGGWLLFDRAGQDPLAHNLVGPAGRPQHAWFYFIPKTGSPTVIAHAADIAAFAQVPGTRVAYRASADLDRALSTLLKKVKVVAMSYSPKGALPTMSRVDAGTLERVRAKGPKVVGSQSLVQGTKARWSSEQRIDHSVAAHHLAALRTEAMQFIGQQLAAGKVVTEWSVAQQIEKGMAMRGVVGPTPRVATGVNTADPQYAPTPRRSAQLRPGQVVTLRIAAKVKRPTGVFAAASWVAYLGPRVPDDVAQAFAIVAGARDRATTLIGERLGRRRMVTGADADRAARDFITSAGFGDLFLHRTGHSLDADLQGGGADLDSLEVNDTRPLVQSSGFTVGPGAYFAGKFGVRSEVSAYIGPNGLEITTPAQTNVQALSVTLQ